FSSAHGEYLEVLLAQREALEARSEFIETRQQQMAALVDLYQALGGGWQS
ncbi:MAG: TolC family protein, partial [Pseudomonadota bacterium]|nr:TolC family protein [Pseudomonadota bacterium]